MNGSTGYRSAGTLAKSLMAAANRRAVTAH
jgi:hypothetical protein